MAKDGEMKHGPGAGRIEKLFDSISGDYDRLNHLLSLGIDRSWRRRALKWIVEPGKTQAILDVACGTGDLSIAIARKNGSAQVTGVDLSEGMLKIMSGKVARAGLDAMITAEQGNCESLRFADGTFDRVTIAFGIRNFAHREAALKEILRVLKPGGRLVILELSVPSWQPARWAYKLYFTKILPMIGGAISGDKAAYRYLPASVLAFPGKREWMATMASCGYSGTIHKAFSLGICRMYTGEKQ